MKAGGATADDDHLRACDRLGCQERSTVPGASRSRSGIGLTLYYRHQASLEHLTGSHPENPGRILAIEAALDAAGWPGLERVDAPRATREQLERAHDPGHVTAIESFCQAGGGMIDLDTAASAGSWEAALRAAGAACEAAERLLAGDSATAFCGLRPPGHHAERDRAMGFCLFNNVAVAAEHVLTTSRAERILVLDWDVHHGNGTEAIFKASDRVLYASIHESPLYPGTGDASYVGEGAGEGYTVNLPVAAGADSALFLALVQHVVVPVTLAFRPDLIVISAGFDAHRADPLASCMVDEDGYRQMAASMRAAAAELGVPVLVCLEGGYDPGALGRSAVATVEALSGDVTPADSDRALVTDERDRIARHWPV